MLTIPRHPYPNDLYLRGGSLPARLKLHPDSPFDAADTQDVTEAIAQATATGKHPVGFNVRHNVDYAKLLEQVKRMGGCRAMLFRCDASALHRLHDFRPHVDTLVWLPNAFVPERLYIDAPDAKHWIAGRRAELAAAGFQPGAVWLHLHNEPGWNVNMLAWEVAAIDYAANFGERVVALNQAVGNPNEHAVGMAHEVLKLAAEHPDNVLIGIHDGYFSVFGDRKYPWYLGRWQAKPEELGGGHSYESYRAAQGFGPLRYLITEAGAEDIADDHPYTSKLPRTGGRTHVGPVHANEAAWQAAYGAVYGGKDVQYLHELQRAWDKGKMGDSRIAGVCLFSWGA